MRPIRYNVAASLDGYIAGPNGEFDWIIMDPSIDFAALFKDFDTLLMGRHSFEVTHKGSEPMFPHMKTVVCSRSLSGDDLPDVDIANDAVARARELKSESGGDIWLFGGGALFRSLLDARLVDSVEVSVIPIILGGGIPLAAPGPKSPPLSLRESKSLPSGIVMLKYSVEYT